MADEREVIIKIKSEYENKGNVDAEKGLNKVEKQAKKTTDEIKKGASSSGDSFSGLAKKVLGVASAIAVVKGAISFFAESVQAAAENARAVNTLAAAYKAVGYDIEGAMKQAQDFATKMQNLTGIADEAFLNAQRLLANYGVVGTKAQEAIQAAYALSIGRNVDFASAMDLVAKAAAGQTQTLSRYGIVLGDNVKESEKFEAVLSKINDLFGETAQAAMGDTISKTNALKQAWGDFKEDIGSNISVWWTPFLDGIANVIQFIRKLFAVWNSAYANAFDGLFISIKSLKALFLDVARSALESFRPVINVMSHIPKFGNSIQATFDNATGSLEKMSNQAKEEANVLKEIRTPIKSIFEVEKDLNEATKARLKLKEEEINKNRQNTAAVKETGKAQEDNLKRQQKILDNLGLSTSKDLKGWGKASETSEPAPTDLEVAAGGGNALASAADSVSRYDIERENLRLLYEEKKAYIEQEITDEQLKQEALLNLQTQYDQQVLTNDKNQAKARQQVMGAMWGALTSLASSSNKKVAAVGKVASVAQATMSMFTGAAKALELPFPANLAAVATVLAQGAALVEQIQSVKLAEGGLVKAVTGGINTVIGEGGSDEAVLPLDNTRAMRRIGSAIGEAGGIGGGVVVNINVQASGGVEAILEQLTEASRSGVVQALEFANLNYQVGQQQQGLSV